MREMTLLAPGLLGPLPPMPSVPRCPTLQTWLSRGSRYQQQGRDYFQTLAYLLCGDTDVAMAQASARADDISLTIQFRADPVHFRADRDHGVLIPGQLLAVREREAAALVDSFNTHFAEDGLRLDFTHPERWYLQLAEDLSLATTPIYEASGRDLQSHLPVGEHQVRWRQILNEAQMLLFQHPVNQARESSGQLSINSLWLWGEGQSQPRNSTSFNRVYSDDLYARGLADLVGVACRPQGDFRQPREKHGQAELLVDTGLLEPASRGDIDAWWSAFQGFCEAVVEPLHEQLKQGGLDAVTLLPANGQSFHINRSRLRHFWRRPRSMHQWIQVYD